MNKSEYKQIFFNIKPIKTIFLDIEELYDDLKNLDIDKISHILKEIDMTNSSLDDNELRKSKVTQFQDSLISDITKVLNAHEVNYNALGYSPLTGTLFSYYLYIKNLPSPKNKKLIKLSEKIKKSIILENTRDSLNSKDYKIRYWDRLLFKLFITKGKTIDSLVIKQKRLDVLEEKIKKIYVKKLHKDSFYKIFFNSLLDKKLTTEVIANKIIKKVFKYEKYITKEKAENDITKESIKLIFKGKYELLRN